MLQLQRCAARMCHTLVTRTHALETVIRIKTDFLRLWNSRNSNFTNVTCKVWSTVSVSEQVNRKKKKNRLVFFALWKILIFRYTGWDWKQTFLIDFLYVQFDSIFSVLPKLRSIESLTLASVLQMSHLL